MHDHNGSFARQIGPILPLPLVGMVIVVAGLQGCQTMTGAGSSSSRVEWGMVDDQPVHLYTIRNSRGMTAKITDYGGIITELHVPDGTGQTLDVVLGFETLEEYVAGNPYFGAMVGRVGNRIAGGRFELDGQTYQLATNNGPNHLHGGVKGFDKVVWNAEPIRTKDGPGLRLTYHSPDGEERYPGAVDVQVDYILSNDNELIVETTATCDAATPVNIVHHSYWNLAGHNSGTILDHVLRLDCSRYTPVDETLIPTGAFASVTRTPFDFTEPRAIGDRITQLPASGGDPGGYDINYCIGGHDGNLRRAARVTDPKSGRSMEVWTNMPGIQFYSGNFLDGIAGKNGATYVRHAGFCLETQYYPDAINKRGLAGWPDPVLRPGETYRHVMVHRFE